MQRRGRVAVITPADQQQPDETLRSLLLLPLPVTVLAAAPQAMPLQE